MFDELIAAVTGTASFSESIKAYIANFSFNSAVILIMMVFMIVGAVDKIRGNKKGYGAAFDEGFYAMGPLAVAMVGVIAAAPVLCMLLQPIITPIYALFGASPAVFATTLLASDMGGYSLAMTLAGDDPAVGNFAGLIVGTTMGCIVLFDIPVALSIVPKRDRSILACGILCGLVTVPVGCIAGGLAMRWTPYPLDLLTLIKNVIPVTIIAVLIAIGLWVAPETMMRGFNKFGGVVTAIITVCTVIAVFQYQTGIRLPLAEVMVEEDAAALSPLKDGLLTVGNIALVLIGAFPMVEWIKRTFRRPLISMGRLLGVDETASAGFVANLANNIPVFNMIKDMNPKGKLLNIAFAVCAAFVFGDHLGFTAGVNQEMILPVIVAKLTCGICALILASLLSAKLLEKALKAGSGDAEG